MGINLQCETETIEGNMHKKSKTYTYTFCSEKDFSTLGMILGTEMELHYIKNFQFFKIFSNFNKKKNEVSEETTCKI